ncbi:hypothetical protein K493DRAFT_88108 [Basidiobolus meristosporus CBS 931.73]|uniref:AN1-type domain-containing protein n=1 Tax=Basidiobolus meristosporus CBS 931.73 TaxID=1314790 RepID=A0A1Y1XF70_9FUNG|nr:hypothetical protein K493DRAFT_88108 [Basidiobolus meristosporus CBS 931.73]|eukprot:ORX84004.1 hypothetical protein K493DRAFT_88108 [Basidiobolus meristosporus CBS 931.73]
MSLEIMLVLRVHLIYPKRTSRSVISYLVNFLRKLDQFALLRIRKRTAVVYSTISTLSFTLLVKMEFPGLGSQCTFKSCQQLDFLPFRCGLCDNIFCAEHRSIFSHSCPEAEDTKRFVCATCGLALEVEGRTDTDQISKEHLESGCKRHVLVLPSIKKKCQLDSCGQAETIVSLCLYCSGVYCLKHRHAADHQCVSSEQTAIKAQEKRKTIQDLISKNIKKPTTTSSAHVPAKPRKKSPVVELMRMKGKAKGDNGLPQAQRFYLKCFLPIESKSPPVIMFFDKSWSLGRVLDKVTSVGKVINMNNRTQDPTQKLHIFLQRSGEKLPITETLEQLEGQIFNGDTLVIEKTAEATIDSNLYLD